MLRIPVWVNRLKFSCVKKKNHKKGPNKKKSKQVSPCCVGLGKKEKAFRQSWKEINSLKIIKTFRRQ